MTVTKHTALYFGCWQSSGHYLHTPGGTRHHDTQQFPSLPWGMVLMDTGLLKNGKHSDICDGKVYWTFGGLIERWFAFFWWDRSIDHRGGSNSGIYVSGFQFSERDEAFEYGLAQFPHVVERQAHPLILQEK